MFLILIFAPNQPPVANAGTDRTVTSGSAVTLSGTASRDPDGDITSYSWIQVEGQSIILYGANIASPTFSAPSNLSVNASSTSDTAILKFSLTVKDDKGVASTNPAMVSVTVKAASSSQSITAPSVPYTQTMSSNATSMATTLNNQTTSNLTSRLASVDGIPCDHLEHTIFHHHTHIDIFVDGKAITIPKNIGIVPGECLHWIHTHDETGTIHMESPMNFDYTLGVFFDIWGKQFDQMLRQYNCCNMSTPVSVCVNGIKMTPDNTRNIPLKSHDEMP